MAWMTIFSSTKSTIRPRVHMLDFMRLILVFFRYAHIFCRCCVFKEYNTVCVCFVRSCAQSFVIDGGGPKQLPGDSCRGSKGGQGIWNPHNEGFLSWGELAPLPPFLFVSLCLFVCVFISWRSYGILSIASLWKRSHQGIPPPPPPTTK